MISLTELLPINERNKVFLRVPNDIKKIYKLFKKILKNPEDRHYIKKDGLNPDVALRVVK